MIETTYDYFQVVLFIVLTVDLTVLTLSLKEFEREIFLELRKALLLSMVVSLIIVLTSAYLRALIPGVVANLVPESEYRSFIGTAFAVSLLQIVLFIGWYIHSRYEFDYNTWDALEFLTLMSILWLITPPILRLISITVPLWIYIISDTVIAFLLFLYFKGIPLINIEDISSKGPLKRYIESIARVISVASSLISINQYLNNILGNVFYISIIITAIAIAIFIFLYLKTT